MMVGSTAGGSSHGTCILYVNAQRKVSLVDPLVPHLLDSILGGLHLSSDELRMISYELRMTSYELVCARMTLYDLV